VVDAPVVLDVPVPPMASELLLPAVPAVALPPPVEPLAPGLVEEAFCSGIVGAPVVAVPEAEVEPEGFTVVEPAARPSPAAPVAAAPVLAVGASSGLRVAEGPLWVVAGAAVVVVEDEEEGVCAEAAPASARAAAPASANLRVMGVFSRVGGPGDEPSMNGKGFSVR
jgi:hypothetical protein